MNLVFNEICWGYAASVFGLTFLVLSYITKSPNKWVKIAISVVVGISVGVVWFYTKEAKITTLVLSFLVQSILYQWGAKELFKKLGYTYDNKKGIV